MSSQMAKEIDCLTRLHTATGQLTDILLYLKQEGIINDNEIRSVHTSANHPKEVRLMLKNLQAAGKLQLLEYTWSVLPVENIRVFIVCDRSQKEFVYNG